MSSTTKRVGKHTIQFANPPVIVATASVVGPKEGEGPLGNTFDMVITDTYFGEESWEKAERKMLEEAVKMVIAKAQLQWQDIDYLLAGDLLNQTISANYTARNLGIPFLGLYGACSTMYEGMALASILIDGGFATHVVAACSSHYDTAERQYRYPTEQGVQRPPTAQWTVTGAGAVLLAPAGNGPRITHATIGRVLDMGVKDPNDMGSAMAPAAVDTLVRHFQDTGRSPTDYDLIITGDLGRVGRELALKLAAQNGYDLGDKYTDCGLLIYDSERQGTYAGGSGCACSAVVFAGHLMGKLNDGTYKRILGIGTGALLSPTSTYQGESIPSIGHAVVIEKI
ncbi:stage V sporulation protein AD [Thermanaeromonas toyohensis ToBE]|uniref:Stage V sporulation protein AD n=1 Tax=Thermanaeromonas toyohensis ToBE TaxID=698762 RepID=A0A1W1VYM5_9FIRM|nr:stage V sporulation protein AD [Thermanaeromonas toyohensis]SMB98458.1 stage V sporulation protein AD [Thermanaeromonas toyohensis ToBE]